jgi:hypothetical protein
MPTFLVVTSAPKSSKGKAAQAVTTAQKCSQRGGTDDAYSEDAMNNLKVVAYQIDS